MKQHIQWQKSLLKSIQLQLFISFISLPFLISWGLPISILTPISTLIFGPFLTCFLLVSSLIFFLELLYLPNALFIWCLEHITSIWLACLNLEQRTWLIGFAKPPIIILMVIPLIALATIHSKKINSIKTRITFLALLLIATCITLTFFSYATSTSFTKIPCNNGEITLINHNNTLLLIDPAFIAARPSYESFISYTLIPEIIQRTGCMHIEHLIICKFNKRILDAIQFLATKINIKHLYIPAWKNKIPFCAWRSYKQLKKIITDNNGTISSISYTKKLSLDHRCTLVIEPLKTKNIRYYDALYQPLCIKGILDNQTFVL